MGFLSTRFGAYAKKMAKLTEKKVMQTAYTPSVLAQMADLNNQQLDEGLYADGRDTPDYSPFTIEIKRAKGQEWRFMTFYDTGETRNSIRYLVRNGKLVVTMNDRFNLMDEYSQNIIGLTANSIADVKDEIIEEIQSQMLPE